MTVKGVFHAILHFKVVIFFPKGHMYHRDDTLTQLQCWCKLLPIYDKVGSFACSVSSYGKNRWMSYHYGSPRQQQ